MTLTSRGDGLPSRSLSLSLFFRFVSACFASGVNGLSPSQAAAAAQKEAELTESHIKDRAEAIAAMEKTHEETLTLERRKSVQSLSSAETRHAETMDRTKAKYKKKVERAAREAAEKAGNAERSRSKKRMKKLREKHHRKLIEAERRRRAIAQHVSSIQARVLSNSYPGSCFYCGESFGFFNRQHHCRGCGMAVCDACSEKRISRKNLRLSQAQWNEMCSSDANLAELVDVEKWGSEEAEGLLPENMWCCNACYGNRTCSVSRGATRSMTRPFNYDDNARDQRRRVVLRAVKGIEGCG